MDQMGWPICGQVTAAELHFKLDARESGPITNLPFFSKTLSSSTGYIFTPQCFFMQDNAPIWLTSKGLKDERMPRLTASSDRPQPSIDNARSPSKRNLWCRKTVYFSWRLFRKAVAASTLKKIGSRPWPSYLDGRLDISLWVIYILLKKNVLFFIILHL